MRSPRLLDVALVTGAMVVSSAASMLNARPWGDWLFVTVLSTLAALVVASGVRAVSVARRQHREAAQLLQTSPGESALRAIAEERRRLGADIASLLRGVLARIHAVASDPAHMETPDVDPRPAFRAIHTLTRLAASDLRRHLGLLRAEQEPLAEPPALSVATRLPGSDVWLGTAAAGLAAVEAILWSSVEGVTISTPAVLWSALAASTLAGRRAAPGLAAALCGLVFGVASLTDAWVRGGFWSFATLGGLMWALSSRGRSPLRDLGGAVVLTAGVVWSRIVDDRDNLFINVFVIVGVGAAGLLVRAAGAREARARAVARARQLELDSAREIAVAAERIGFARELHDVVSHAVGLIAVQAAAGQVSWPEHPERAVEAMAAIRTAARSTLEDLDGLLPGQQEPARTSRDLHRLVDRIRAAGTPATLVVEGNPHVATQSVVYRVAQEALTNAVRHAPGAVPHVAVHWGVNEVVVSVVDDGPGPAVGEVRGYGLVGLSERVALVGGDLQTGAAPEGGFRLVARVPFERTAVTP